MKKTILIILLAITGGFGKISAQSTLANSNNLAWHKIGENELDLKKNTCEIISSENIHLASIKITVKESSIHLYVVEAYYSNHDKQVMQVDKALTANTESEIFDLRGRDGNLQKIVLVYKGLTAGNDKNPHVELLGIVSSQAASKPSVSIPNVMLIDTPEDKK
jgi:hypothetical protein